MVKVRSPTRRSLRLVIDDKPSPEVIEIAGKEELRQLANDIMEEFPEDDDGSDDSGSESRDDSSGPTFTYPSEAQLEPDCVDPWERLTGLLGAGNGKMVKLLISLGISPDIESLADFYYANYDTTGVSHQSWKSLDSLNTILCDDAFSQACLGEEWFH